ncbi:MAG: T9SS type A sorting domain-containing protein, partial [Phaeodactylibacter sp.]|nr:T9SS type A sorting domain-containing protein [Phaeodactylibacter sp.]
PDAGPDTLLCSSGGINLSVAANAGDIISWVPGDGLSCTDCANPVAEPGETTTYQVTITNAQGCVGIDFVTIYVDEVPGGVIPEEPLVFCPGSPFSLCLPEENQYLWISPIGFIQTGNCLKFPYTSPSIAGQYTLRVELPNGCRITESIELIVGPGCNSFAAPAPSTGTASMLRVFPNPASNHIQIRTSMTGLKQFTLRAMDGRTISQFKQESDAFEFGLQGISSGSYILEMIGESGVEQQILSVH